MIDTAMWVSLSVLAAMTAAGMALIGEYQKHPTIPRLFWVRFICFVVVACFAPFIEWPGDPIFYASVAGLTILICVSDVLYYGSARDNGAGPTSRVEPLSVLMTFAAWSALVPSQWQDYAGKPLVMGGIVACFIVAAWCAMQLRHSPVSHATFKKLLPVIVMMAGVSILGKTAMDHGGAAQHAAIAYLVVQTGMLSIFYAGLMLAWPQRTGPITPNRALLFSAAAMAACSLFHIAPKNIAYTYVANPAYVTVIGLCAPLFVSAFYKVTGRRDEAAVLAGFGIVAAAAALVILTRF